MFKRGVSPLIATVLLVGFTVAIAGVFITWGSGFVKDIQSSTQEASKEKVTCSTNVGVKIKNACIEGSDVKLLIENFGSVDIVNFDVRTIGSLSASNVPISSGLNAYDIQTFNVALDPSIGVLGSVEVFPVVNLAGEDVSCANNFDRRRGIENCVAATGCTFPQISCNSICVTPACSSNANCAAGQTCQNPGTCSAQCIGAGGDTTNPTVSITPPPASGATVSSTIQLTAAASDNVAVANVQFKLDGSNLGTLDTTSPYSITWDTTTATNAQHILTAVATDTSGNTATSASVIVNVNNPISIFGLVGQWKFDENSGTTASDSSGNSNIGTLTNGPTWTAGKIGGALSFDGVNDYVNVADSNSLDLTSGFTLAAWVNPTVTYTDFRSILVKNYVYYLYAFTSGYCGGNGYPLGGGNVGEVCQASVLPANTWTHLAVAYDGSRLRLYKNGVEVSNIAASGVLPATTGTLQIGASQFGEYFTGSIDDVRVYNSALSAAEVQQIFNSGGSGGDTTNPTVSITPPPASGATVSSTIQLTAAASDNVAVANVQFKLDGSNLGTLDTTSPYSITWDTTLTSNGQHVLTAVATDTSGNTATSTSVTVTVNNVVQPANAFTGQYFNNMDFTSLALTRTDNQINFDWSTNSPDPNIGVDTFSVRWQGDFSFTGKVYTFTARTDDGMRIWIDNQLVLDKWIDQAPTTYTFTNTMTSGAHNIKVEYYENGGLAVAQVSWA